VPGSCRGRYHTGPRPCRGPAARTWNPRLPGFECGAQPAERPDQTVASAQWTLSPAQADRYRPLFDNTKRLRELTSELQALSAEVVEQAEGWARP